MVGRCKSVFDWLYKDSDDAGAGTTGRVACGTNPMFTFVACVITIEYLVGTDQFKFYMDGVLKTTVTRTSVAIGASYDSILSRIAFGDHACGYNDHEVGSILQGFPRKMVML
ncbi:MAG: hypothetical protein A2Y12_09745 [Planctomycetes bacterium GWF2_42_9]|nr:MAG: hypothetical protein A2Y12_09745 [Planctomycetes bacterium GWF2_42_9]